MTETIAPDSRVADIVDSLNDPEEYVRAMMANFIGDQHDLHHAVVIIGIVGTGFAPHYKIEQPLHVQIGDRPVQVRGARIYHGRNHKEMTTFANQDTREEHWSSESMTYPQLAILLGELRARPKR